MEENNNPNTEEQKLNTEEELSAGNNEAQASEDTEAQEAAEATEEVSSDAQEQACADAQVQETVEAEESNPHDTEVQSPVDTEASADEEEPKPGSAKKPKLIKLIAIIVAAAVCVSLLLVYMNINKGDGSAVIARVNNTPVTESQLEVAINNQYSLYGFTADMLISTMGETNAYEIANEIRESLVMQQVLLEKAKELGLDKLTEEETEALDATVENYMTSLREYYASSVAEDEDYAELTEEEINTRIETGMQEFLDSYNISEETIREQYKSNLIISKLYDETVKDFAPTEQDYQDYYDSLVNEQMALEESDPDTALSNYTVGTDAITAYIPKSAEEGVKMVKHILVKIPEEYEEEANTLYSEISSAKADVNAYEYYVSAIDSGELVNIDEDDATSKEDEIKNYTELLAESEKTLKEKQDALSEYLAPAYAEIQAKADEALAKVNSGEDFDALIEEYGEDAGMASNPDGYMVYEGASFVDGFGEAAMTLKNAGDTTALVPTVYGYHIIKLVSVPAAGAVPYDDIKDDIKTTVDENMTMDYWYEQATAWKDECSVEYFDIVLPNVAEQTAAEAASTETADEAASSEATETAAAE